MDDDLTERLVYSDSENSEDELQSSNIIPANESVTITQSSFSSPPSPQDLDNTETKQNDDSNDSGEDNLVVTKKSKKSTQILSSDDENSSDKNLNVGNDKNGNESSTDREGSVQNESDQTQSSRNKNENENENEPKPFKSIIRPSICDSDTKSSSGEDEQQKEILKENKKKKKKLTKKVQKKAKTGKIPKEVGSDASGSESQDSDDENSAKKIKKSKKNKEHGSNASSGSSSQTSSNDENDQNAEIKPREKLKQRMSAKAAEEQMREIQSESQRMAREIYVKVPYHKPKQYSLKEFLSRRSIVEQRTVVNSFSSMKAAAAIKMSEEELILYAKKLEEREKEAITFFKSDDSDEDENQQSNANDKIEDHENMATKDSIENKTVESESPNIENIPLDIPMTELETENAISIPEASELDDIGMTDSIDQPSTSAKAAGQSSEIHTERTDLDDELDEMIRSERKSKRQSVLSIATLGAPKLSGASGMVIDFETNELKPKEKSGVENLVERFMKNALVKTPKADSQDVSIFHTDTGSIHTHKLPNIVDDRKSTKEPKPGESYVKLKDELSRKIHEKRREAVYKRLEEEKKQKEMDSEEELDDEYEEYSDCEMVENDSVDGEAVDDEQTNLENIEGVDENSSGKSNEDNLNAVSEDDANDSASDEENELGTIIEPSGTNKRRRILTAFNDSDDEQTETGELTELQLGIQAERENSIERELATQNDHCRTQDTDELLALNTESFIMDTSADLSAKKSDTTKLFDDNNDDLEIGESQLMALCSGSFATQYPTDAFQQTQKPTLNAEAKQPVFETEASRPLAILSSDEDETDSNSIGNKKQKKRTKNKKTIVYSDDEEEETKQPTNIDEISDQEEGIEDGEEIEDEADVEEDEEDVGEKYVEYDSDENEVEVTLKKDDIKKKSTAYLENEAELSESEWGSDDENENGMNEYEAELGDTEVFDESKIQSELERIRLRQQIDQDAKEVRILTERFIEEEDNGQERERKFRWKHLNDTNMDEQSLSVEQQDDDDQAESEDENEEEWRRQRFEREQKLKEEMEKNAAIAEPVSEIVETTIGNITTDGNPLRRISVIKTPAPPRISSPFLIQKSALSTGHLSRKSFLSRDTSTLVKLAGLTKSSGDGETIVNTVKGKGNYVFVATEKKNDSKRKSDADFEANGAGPSIETLNPRKKSKLMQPGDNTIRPQTKTFLDLLSK